MAFILTCQLFWTQHVPWIEMSEHSQSVCTWYHSSFRVLLFNFVFIGIRWSLYTLWSLLKLFEYRFCYFWLYAFFSCYSCFRLVRAWGKVEYDLNKRHGTVRLYWKMSVMCLYLLVFICIFFPDIIIDALKWLEVTLPSIRF